MSFEEPDNPFFLSFTDVLTCVLGGSVALFLIFVVMVKLVPALDASKATLSGRVGLDLAVEKERLAGNAPAVLQIVSKECGKIKSIKIAGKDKPEIWDFITRDAQRGIRCGKMMLFKGGLPKTLHTVSSDSVPGEPLRVTLSIGAYTWSPLIKIDHEEFVSFGNVLMKIDGSTRQLIRFASFDKPSAPFESEGKK